MAQLSTPPLSVYVHFPWCVRKCPYCDFNSYTLHGELDERRYVDALARDLEAQAAEVAGREVVSLFFGGGTPSLFSPLGIARVIDSARRHLRLAADIEVTMEANPGAIERGRFAEYRAAGLTRVSLGAQSFDATRLEALGRIHSPDETRRAAAELHAAGLDNFNLDLMYALPGQDVEAAVRDVEVALAQEPAHISHYQLTIEQGTVFAAQPPALPEDDTAADMLTACAARLAEAGFAHYEVSAYARSGRQCRHNLNYWTFGDYLGVGAGAHGKLTFPQGSPPGPPTERLARKSPAGTTERPATERPAREPPAGARESPAGMGWPIAPPGSASVIRTQQLREPRRYLSTSPAVVTRTEVVPEQLPFEFMLNALRLVEGFEVATFETRTGLDWETVAGEVDALVGRGLLLQEGTSVKPSAQGLQFLNDLLLSFMGGGRRQSAKMAGAFGLSTGF